MNIICEIVYSDVLKYLFPESFFHIVLIDVNRFESNKAIETEVTTHLIKD